MQTLEKAVKVLNCLHECFVVGNVTFLLFLMVSYLSMMGINLGFIKADTL